MKKLLAVMTCVAVSLSPAAQADIEKVVDKLLLLSMDDLMSLKVRISTNTDQTLARAPSAVTLITAEDIEATGATNLTDILQSVPGLYVRPNLFGFRPFVTFRGASSTHTLLMVNGVPMRDLVWSNGIFWKGLPTHMIERIEIIRGPGSALLGSDASAGVVNVITKTAGRIGQNAAGIRLSTYDSQSGWIQQGGNWNGIELGLTAQLSHTAGHAPWIAADGQTAADTAFGTTVSHAPGHANYGWNGQDLRFSATKGHWRLLADYMGHTNLETGFTGAAVMDPVTEGRDYRYDIGLLYGNEHFAQDWGLNAELRYRQLGYSSGDGFQERPPGFTDASGTYPDGWINRQRSAERGATLEVSGLYTGMKRHAIRLGGGYQWEDLYLVEQFVNFGTGPNGVPLPAGGPLVNISDTDYAFAPELSRKIAYVYAQDIWTISEDWELTAGLRHDRYSDFGNALNPRLALVWQSTDRLTTKLMYGEAFRAPSILELYSKTSSIISNPSLTPEESKTLDLAFTYAASKRLTLGLDIYRFAQSNLIANDSGTYRNIGNNRTYGAELEVQWQPADDWRISGSLSHMNTSTPASVSLTSPRQKAYLRSDWALMPAWNWNVQATWIGERELDELSKPPRPKLGAYTLVDTTIRYAPRGPWQFSASVRNLFDEEGVDYTSSAITNNLPLPGRSVYAEIAYKF